MENKQFLKECHTHKEIHAFVKVSVKNKCLNNIYLVKLLIIMLGIKQKIRFVLQKNLCYTITIVINLTLNIQKSLLYFFKLKCY